MPWGFAISYIIQSFGIASFCFDKEMWHLFEEEWNYCFVIIELFSSKIEVRFVRFGQSQK